jgi:hypothetical protein
MRKSVLVTILASLAVMGSACGDTTGTTGPSPLDTPTPASDDGTMGEDLGGDELGDDAE